MPRITEATLNAVVDKIAVIKTGWSDDFMGSPVDGAHKHVRKFRDGHEKYNFLPGPDGRFYAYTPPVGRFESAPNPEELDDWLVFALAKAPSRPGLYLTGWYEHASFKGDYVDRPEYRRKRPALPRDQHGQNYAYTLSADNAARVDPAQDPFVFPGDHMKRAAIFYLRGNGQRDVWRDRLAEKLLAARRKIGDGRAPVSIAGSSRGGICADTVRRQQVEAAAIALVKAKFRADDYEIDDKQLDRCHFDLLVWPRNAKDQQLHIEVKGTQNAIPHFLMSRGEYAHMRAHRRRWRLALVTNALSRKPTLEILKSDQAQARFSWEAFTWHATSRP